MKKTTLFLAAAALGGSLLAVASRDSLRREAPEQPPVSAMGFLISDDSRPVGWYTFPVTDASSPSLIGESPSVSAGAMADGTYYAQTYTPGPVPLAWNTVDVSSGTMTKLADFSEGSPLYVDMTYDYSKGRLLAISHYGARSTYLRQVNVADGTSTVVADLPDQWLMTLACSYDGEIYSIANDGFLYRFDDVAGSFSRVGTSQAASGVEYMQSMEFDHSSSILYWTASTSWGGYLYLLDPMTGTSTYVSDLGSDGEMTGLYIPFKMAEEGAPAAVTELSVSDPAHDGAAVVKMRLPSLTAAGEELTEISSVVIEADGAPVKTWSGMTLSPGQEVSLETALPLGFHTFKVYAVNGVGNGVPRCVRVFIGEDLPAAPAGITVEADGLDATISWTAVETGAQGGYVDPSKVTYEVVRKPGDVVVASSLSATVCSDRLDKMGVYTYCVTAVSPKGNGPQGSSAPTVVGSEMPLPYTCGFSDPDELLMWTRVDGNEDGATWEQGKTMDGKPTMMMRGAYTRTVDDYLITPPLRLEAGKAYKVVYDAGCMNMYYPAHYTVTFGRQATAEGQQTVVKEFTTDLRMLNKTYVYLPEIEETGVYYLGFHAQWEPGLPTLYISNVTVEENSSSWLTGTVTDGSSPLAGAVVTFGDEGQTFTTGEDGKFEFIEITPGTYPWTASKFGFEPSSGTYEFSPLEHKDVEISLTPIPVASISGRVVDAEGHGLENASVYVHGYDVFNAVTDRDGNFSVSGVYRKGGYTVDIHALNYEPVSRSLESLDGDTDLGSLVCQEKLIAPGNVKAEADKARSVVSWDAPADVAREFRYDDGTDNYVFNMEMSSTSEYTVVGVIYDTPAVFTSMSWHVWDTATYAESVDVVVFDLDENGNPTNRILYDQRGLESENYNWHECVFKYPVVAPRGALFTLRGDARLCMDSGGEDANWPTMYDKMVMTHDYRTEPFTSRYADDGSYIFRGNLLLRANGLPYGAPRKAADASAAPDVKYDVWRLAEGDEAVADNWLKLNGEPVSETSLEDATWGDAAKGMWLYAVKAVHSDGNLSSPSFSPAVPRLMTSDVALSILTNAPGEDASQAAVLLSGNGHAHSYSAEADAEGKILLKDVWEGEYLLTCTKKGFEPLSETVYVVGGEDADLSFTLVETTNKPFNLIVEEAEEPSSRLLRWNVVTDIFEDFESHDDWAINSPGEIGWSYIDGDGDETYFSPNYSFPNAGEPMAYIVMNPSQADPDMTSGVIDTHSGDKVLVCWSNRHGIANDDYIISPRLEIGKDFVLAFWTRGYWWRYEEYLCVGYSMEGKEAGDFTWIGDPVKVDYDQWQQIVTTIPAGAAYVAIRCISETNNYLLAIDDIFIGSPENLPGATASNSPSRVAGTVLGYDVYLDNEKVGSTTGTSHLFENLAKGNHTAGVTARYASGQTEMATVDFSIDMSGIGDVDADGSLTVRALEGVIKVAGAADGAVVKVYRPDGALVASAETRSGMAKVSVAPGYYIVTVGRTTVSLRVP